jgi:beta-galactosidase
MKTTSFHMAWLQRRFQPRLLIMGRPLVAAFLAGSSLQTDAAQEAAPVRARLSINEGWRFIKGDPAEVGDKLRYSTIKPWVVATGADFTTNAPVPKPEGGLGEDVTYAQAAFNDSAWRTLNLPHDWGVEGAFKQELSGNTGRLPWAGIGWYRKHFTVPAEDQGKQFRLEVDGAMAYATVWLNGRYVGGWPYGYSSFCLDLTPFIKLGAENILAIRLDNPPNSSRWYPGGGIYRNVWLLKTGPVHVGQWGTFVTTPQVTKTSARVNVKVKVDNDSSRDAEVMVATEIYALDSHGKKTRTAVAAATPIALKVAANSSGACDVATEVRNPALWSINQPSRYAAVTTIHQGGKVVDTYETPFGVRSIKFTADNGFLLNGERVPLNGVCDHHDLGALGSAINTRALERQVQLLKEMGCNAIRTSHNPPAPELLEVCDRLGMVVMDEAFDCWSRQKTRNDYHLLFADWHEKDLRMLVRRDRNHPCVVLWSIGNEIPEQGSATGVQIGTELAGIVHSEDTTRPVTAACDNLNAAFNGFQKVLDVFGYNYKPKGYAKAREANPDLPLFGSETASTVSSRGVYTVPVAGPAGAITNPGGGRRGTNAPAEPPPGLDVPAHQVSSHDLYYPPWATSPDAEFTGQERNPSVAGEFVWTGFDYLGEPTPWGGESDPSRNSYFGIIDLAGFKKDRFYLYQAHWRPDFPMAHIVPHWTWPERVGQVTPVFVYTSGDEAELFLNGKSLGKRKQDKFEYRLRWDDVVYQPGELKVVAYKHGKKWAADTVKTAGPAARLELRPDRDRITADGKDLSWVTVSVADKNGVTVPRSKNHIRFEIEGPVEIVATDNGDATSFEPFQAPEHDAFSGLALAIVRAKPGQAGTIKLTAKSDGLKPATVIIRSKLAD